MSKYNIMEEIPKGALRSVIKPGSIIYDVQLKYNKRTGISEHKFFAVKDNALIDLTMAIAHTRGLDELHKITCSGPCGFNIVHNLSVLLFDKGAQCISKDCSIDTKHMKGVKRKGLKYKHIGEAI